MRTDMEFMNRVFHTALRRDLERAIGSLTPAARPTQAQRAALAEHVNLFWTYSTITTQARTPVYGHSSAAAPPTSAPS